MYVYIHLDIPVIFHVEVMKFMINGQALHNNWLALRQMYANIL